MGDKPGPDPTAKPGEILRILKLAYPPALGTTDIADEIGISQQATQKHLRRLEGDGFIESRKVGRAKIWWLTDEGEKRASSYSDESQ